MNKRQDRKKQIGIEMNDELIKDLKSTAKKISIPYSQIVREAVAEKLVQIKANHPIFKLQEN